MRCDFTSESCFSGMLKYPGLIVVGELGSDDAKKPWFLLLMFCSYVCHLITSGVVCSCCFTVAGPFWEPVCRCSCETSSLWEEFWYAALWPWVISGVQTETQRILCPCVPWCLCPEGSLWVPLSRISGLTFAHGHVCTPWWPPQSWQYLGFGYVHFFWIILRLWAIPMD